MNEYKSEVTNIGKFVRLLMRRMSLCESYELNESVSLEDLINCY